MGARAALNVHGDVSAGWFTFSPSRNKISLDERLWSTVVSLRARRTDFGVLDCEVREHTYRVERIDQFTIPLDPLGANEDSGL